MTLSNVDRSSFSEKTRASQGDVGFEAVYIAQHISSYKPEPGNFLVEYLAEVAHTDASHKRH
ncbi:hypothetical protein LZ31DRAFT_561197 [Colletotrichum somersetense]|nr:hypothetical protein LZ31DRAFT_561197 [Colletotrichum somersetense]